MIRYLRIAICSLTVVLTPIPHVMAEELPAQKSAAPAPTIVFVARNCGPRGCRAKPMGGVYFTSHCGAIPFGCYCRPYRGWHKQCY